MKAAMDVMAGRVMLSMTGAQLQTQNVAGAVTMLVMKGRWWRRRNAGSTYRMRISLRLLCGRESGAVTVDGSQRVC